MKQELLIVVGMPGSGKSTYVRSLISNGEIDGFCDDYEYGPIRSIDPKVDKKDEVLLHGINEGKRMAIADTRYCDPLERTKIEKELNTLYPHLKFKYIYYENNPELCMKNVIIRNNNILPPREIQLIYYYTAIYQIPKGAKIVPVPKAIKI